MNVITITGKICTEIETRHTPAGKVITKFNVAVMRPFVKGKMDFFKVELWGDRNAEFLSQYFCRKKPIEVTGYMKREEFETSEGNKKTIWTLAGQQVGFAPQDQTHQEPQYSDEPAGDPTEESYSDVPF